MKTRLLLLILSISLFSCKDKYADLPDGLFAEINTSKGTVIAELEFEKTPLVEEKELTRVVFLFNMKERTQWYIEFTNPLWVSLCEIYSGES